MNMIEIIGSIITDNGKSITNGFLESIDLTIEKGDLVAFVGDKNSGIGKIIKVISGQERITRGEFFLFGNLIKYNNKSYLSNLIKNEIKYINYKGNMEFLMEELKDNKPLIIIENLDLEESQYDIIIETLKEKRNTGATIVVSTKNDDFALRFYRRIYVYDGKIQKEVRILKSDSFAIKENIKASM